jgi:hypothetical protein
MKIQMKNGLVRDVDRTVGEVLIASELATEVVKVAATEVHNIVWSARPGPRVEDYEYPPRIAWKCSCGELGYTESFKGTAHEVSFHHRGTAVRCSPDVAETYIRLYAKWRSKSKKPLPPETPRASTAVTDRRILSNFGLKTKEELLAEAQVAALAK